MIWYTSRSVFYRLSSNCKNIHVYKFLIYAKMKWLVTAKQRQFRKYSCHKSPKNKAVLHETAMKPIDDIAVLKENLNRVISSYTLKNFLMCT